MERLTSCVRKGMKLLCYMPKMTILKFFNPCQNVYPDITPLLNCLLTHQFCSSTISELHFENIGSDPEVFSEFLMTTPSLSKLVINNVHITHGKLSQFPGPSLKELFINTFSDWNLNAYLSAFSQTVSVIECESLGLSQISRNQGNDTTCIKLERVKIFYQDGNFYFSKSSLDNNPLHMFPSAVKYMLHLQRLDLSCAKMDPEICEKLFDSFSETIQQQLICSHMGQTSPVSRATIPYSLQLQELDLSGNIISDSIGKFVSVFKNMNKLRLLKLVRTQLEEHHCCALFDCFIEMGRRKEELYQKTLTVPNTFGVSTCGLGLEELDLSQNNIGDMVGKLVQAYEYIPNLKRLGLSYTKMNPSQCAQLFDAFIERGKERVQIQKEKEQCNSEMESPILSGCLRYFQAVVRGLSNIIMMIRKHIHERQITDNSEKETESCHTGSDANKPPYVTLEVLYLAGNDISDSAEKLSEACTYMAHLKCLNLRNTSMNPSQCAQLFDGLFARVNTGQCQCLVLQELDISENDIGDSVVKLSQALEYLTSLQSLRLQKTNLNASLCAILFDEFTRVGKVLKGQPAQKKNLNIQILDLSRNIIDECAGEKLAEAVGYMPHLKRPDVHHSRLSSKTSKLIEVALKDIDTDFKQEKEHIDHCWVIWHVSDARYIKQFTVVF